MKFRIPAPEEVFDNVISSDSILEEISKTLRDRKIALGMTNGWSSDPYFKFYFSGIVNPEEMFEIETELFNAGWHRVKISIDRSNVGKETCVIFHKYPVIKITWATSYCNYIKLGVA